MGKTKLWELMDSRVFEAAHLGNINAIRDLIDESADVLEQLTNSSHNSVLHVAARAGQADFVSEILRIKPEILSYVNSKRDTALHEAAREGHSAVVKVLLDKDQRIAYKVNQDYETALFVACKEGHVHVVNELIQVASLLALDSEKPDERTSLHAASTRGHEDIVKELIKARPGLVGKVDNQASSPLHLAAPHGHLEVTRALLTADPEICYMLDGSGRSALHIAAMKGQLSVVHEILSFRPDSADMLSTAGETFLHSAVEANQIEVVKHVVDLLDTSKLIRTKDNEGNTVLHVATRKKLKQIVQWLVTCTTVNVNAVNKQGLTALDILEKEPAHSGALIIGAALKDFDAKRAYELPLERFKRDDFALKRSVNSINHHVRAHHFQTADTSDRVNGMAKELRQLHTEGIKNAGNTVTVVAVLIATVAFAAMFTVPGGLKNDGDDEGTAVMAHTVAFKVFVITDTVALFSSFAIVLILVTVVPFHRKVLMKLLFFINKIMWVAVGCTASAFLAAGYVVVGPKSMWVAISMCGVGGGSMVFMFTSLAWLVAGHQMKKARLRKSKKRRNGERVGRSRSRDPEAIITHLGEEESEANSGETSERFPRRRIHSSSDSDFESSEGNGFHPL
ncbi:ankyrin repeat-containing protein At2g01680-like [Cryptomeria japonica]|uniref:ankyrin repeat-containing protein At2g01680-like n=1 Tax=Cryptomeria japonica TaxID=3369 RepID=UPI0027DA2185|nr:ankyrin repeat-containing protein At2g01680-like [Cryptomeria japonica]